MTTVSEPSAVNKMVPRWIFTVVLALIVSLVAVATYRAPNFELSARSAGMAETLTIAERLTNGSRDDGSEVTQQTAPSGGVGYPLILAAFAKVDSRLNAALTCHKKTSGCALAPFQSLIIAQFIVTLAAIFLMFWIAATLSRSWLVALATIILAFLAGSYGAQAGALSPVPWLKALVLVTLGAIAVAIDRDQPLWALIAGTAFGAASLFMPDLFVVGILGAFLLLCAGFVSSRITQRPTVQAIVFLIGLALAPLALWFLGPQPEDFVGVLEHTLHANWLARLHWTALSTQNHIALLLGPIPILGPILQAIFDLPPVERLATLAQHAQPAFDLGTYVAATPGLLTRGLWAGTPLITLLGVIHLWPLLKFAKADQRFGPILCVVGFVMLTVIVHGLASPNPPDANVGLIFVLSFATAYVFARSEVRRNFWPRVTNHAHPAQTCR